MRPGGCLQGRWYLGSSAGPADGASWTCSARSTPTPAGSGPSPGSTPGRCSSTLSERPVGVRAPGDRLQELACFSHDVQVRFRGGQPAAGHLQFLSESDDLGLLRRGTPHRTLGSGRQQAPVAGLPPGRDQRGIQPLPAQIPPSVTGRVRRLIGLQMRDLLGRAERPARPGTTRSRSSTVHHAIRDHPRGRCHRAHHQIRSHPVRSTCSEPLASPHPDRQGPAASPSTVAAIGLDDRMRPDRPTRRWRVARRIRICSGATPSILIRAGGGLTT